MIKILIADDHAIVREGLKQILSDTRDMVVAGESGTVQETLNIMSRKRFDVLLLDISMPGGGGLEVLKQVSSHRPKLPILVLSMHPEDQYALRVLKTGASGYLSKDCAPKELIKAVRKVAQGMKYVSPSLALELARAVEFDRDRPIQEMLSDREYQVMCMISSGKTVKEIARDLLLSVKTISTYRTRVLAKMRMKNNAELTHFAIANHLVMT